ncbi:hypothetical protein FA15DRAFT_685924 [Coprinopsis marcescibilis]|uniref:Uncharacterized protein n=1 Tax=Coprinopsis marcescibilis TaxID=230819 RepID=A0A5C3LFW2_COPMA|nr:hypothetical protein FA15DRAFT_685924 [Coprinopsis marcescibilis]
MLHMDVDIHPSPSTGFRAFRQVPMSSGKRARSPEVDNFYAAERPSKRLLVATSGLRLVASDRAEDSPCSSHGVPSRTTSRFPSEDWVKQAGGLSIESPMFHGSRSANSSSENVAHTADVDMVMDLEECEGTSANATASSSRNLPPTLPHRDSSSSLKSHLSRVYPQINVVPATPVLALQTTSGNQPSTNQAQSAQMSPMNLSPVQSFSNYGANPQTQTRRRVTMGPRADCEKCRLGVKGHWMHFD